MYVYMYIYIYMYVYMYIYIYIYLRWIFIPDDWNNMKLVYIYIVNCSMINKNVPPNIHLMYTMSSIAFICQSWL